MSSGQARFEELRMVLVGKTGVGKSAAGNTILEREQFESEPCSSSVTSLCEKARGEVCGREVTVVDTPGLFDTNFTNNEIIQEIKKCVCLSSPGPHVFLVVIQLGRFTQEEQETAKIIQKTFGAESAKYTMVLFTRGDELKRKTIEQFLSGNKTLKEFTFQCHGGYHVFNNQDMQNRSQVSELLQKIDKMVTINGGGCFTNEMYLEAEKAIQDKMMEIQRKNKEMSEKEAREKAERDNAFLNKCFVGGSAVAGTAVGLGAGIYAGAQTGAMTGAVLGPAGAAIGAGVGAGIAVAIVYAKECTIQ